MINLADLLILYDISMFSFSTQEQRLKREIVEKASRLFGANKVALYFCSVNSPSFFLDWGFSDKTDIINYTQHKSTNGFLYRFEDMENEFVYIEKKEPITKDDFRLLTVFAKRIEEAIRRKKYEENLEYLSLHDQLTGLFNRVFFEAELSRLNNSREYPITIIATDLDGLKLVNDTLGHDQGDKLLKVYANVLQKSLRNSDILTRIGGDECVAILPHTDKKDGLEIVRRIQSGVNNYNNQHHDQMDLSISIGMATAENQAKSLEETFREADDLMYRDKMHKGVGAKSQIIKSLMVAVKERDFITEDHARRLQMFCVKLGE